MAPGARVTFCIPLSTLPSGPWFWSCGQTNITCKVVNGKVVEVGKWPWQVSILFLGVYICSGSLIHHHWILTAAHCLQRSALGHPHLGAWLSGLGGEWGVGMGLGESGYLGVEDITQGSLSLRTLLSLMALLLVI